MQNQGIVLKHAYEHYRGHGEKQ